MKKSTFFIRLIIPFFFCLPVHAATISGDARVSEIYVYADAGEGDSIFYVDEPVAGCDGFWLAGSSMGAKNILASLLSAYQTQSTVKVYADETQTFSGSSKKFCRVTVFRLRPKN